METEKENVMYYTDGHAVTVTDSVLHVRKKWYRLNGITSHGFHIIPPFRLPGIILITLGLLILIPGVTQMIPNEALPTFTLGNLQLGFSEFAVGTGSLFLISGILVMVLMRERYAVSITTAEGEKHVVISKQKEYVSQIVNALNEAFFARIHSEDIPAHKQQFTVSGR